MFSTLSLHQARCEKSDWLGLGRAWQGDVEMRHVEGSDGFTIHGRYSFYKRTYCTSRINNNGGLSNC